MFDFILGFAVCAILSAGFIFRKEVWEFIKKIWKEKISKNPC